MSKNPVYTIFLGFCLLNIYNPCLCQIKDIKKKSTENQSKKDTGSSNKSNKKSGSSGSTTYDYLETERDNTSTLDAVFGCLDIGSDIMGSGCLAPSSPGSGSTQPNYTTKSSKIKPQKAIKEPRIRKLDTLSWKQIDPTFLSLDIRAHFDVGSHYSSNKNYFYVDYLPALRANIEVVMIDFRYNILTEYTDDFPDSFTSWELLLMINLLPKEDYKLALGTGLYNEEYTNTIFNEHFLGAKIGLNQNKDFIDAEMRVVVDYKTKAFPFFEIGTRYNKRVMTLKKLFTYISLGVTYQNYYQSHDIWAFRGGILVNIH